MFRVIGDLKVNQGFISDESHAFAPFQTKINPSFVLHFVLWLAYLIDSSEAIKVGGKQKPYKMWQAGISLAALPLAKSLAGFALEVIWRFCRCSLAHESRQLHRLLFFRPGFLLRFCPRHLSFQWIRNVSFHGLYIKKFADSNGPNNAKQHNVN